MLIAHAVLTGNCLTDIHVYIFTSVMLSVVCLGVKRRSNPK